MPLRWLRGLSALAVEYPLRALHRSDTHRILAGQHPAAGETEPGPATGYLGSATTTEA
jgi:hypothetical protein